MRLVAFFLPLLAVSCAAVPQKALVPPEPVCVAPAVVLADHVIDLPQVISDESLAPVRAKFDERAEQDARITFRINSFGGGINAGMDFIQHVEDVKKAHKLLHVNCVVDTRAMSMAFVILQSDVCDERYMTKRSMLLTHQSSTGMDRGGERELREALGQTVAYNEAMAVIASKRLHMPLEQYEAKVAQGDWTMNWQEALKVGAVDAAVDPDVIPAPFKLDSPENPLAKLLGL